MKPPTKKLPVVPRFKPVVLQPKTAVSAQSLKRPVSPPVYRPQPVPKVLQKKVNMGAPSHTQQSPRPLVGPPVYRPEAKKVLQPKTAAVVQRRTGPKAPPVYRPNSTPRVLQRKSATPDHLPYKVPNHRSVGVIQRVVINLDPEDKAIKEAAKFHKERDDRFEDRNTPLIEVGDEPNPRAFEVVGNNEDITIMAHGTPDMGGDEPRVGGKTAAQLFQFLVAMGFRRTHTGIVNLSNCTSAWDRKGTGSFADRFAKILKDNHFENYVTGYESFTESVSVEQELEVPMDKREIFLAHKITERFLMRLMNLRPEDAVQNGGKVFKKIHADLADGAIHASNEARDFLQKRDPTSQSLGQFYLTLKSLIMDYLFDASDKYDEKRIFKFQIQAMELMKKHDLDNLGARLHNQKVKAIPVLLGGGIS